MTEAEAEKQQTEHGSWKRVALVAALFLFCSAFIAIWWGYTQAYGPGPKSEQSHVVVTIERGMSVRDIGRMLELNGLIRDDSIFPFVARMTGKSGSLQAGELSLETGKSMVEMIDQLVHARPVHRTVTIPEGLNGAEIAAIFEKKGLCDRRSYEALMYNRRFIEKLGLGDLPSLEGYLFPDTYYLTKDDRGAEKLISIQVNRFHQVWEALAGNLDKEINREEVVTLASMVEKETGRGSERPLIAGVFLNRLEKKMRLQSDPTVVYGVKDFDGTITKKHLRTPTPYNTYTLPALPAGPIANPGREAMHAVLHPEESKYLYFVAKNDGTHKFSTNLKDHNRAVRKYQR